MRLWDKIGIIGLFCFIIGSYFMITPLFLLGIMSLIMWFLTYTSGPGI